MTTYVQYEGAFRINDLVLTPKGLGSVGALYPDTPYYGGRLVQVTLNDAEYDEEGYPDLDYVERWRDEDLELWDTDWDGFASQLDLLAATVYNVRAQSPQEMTPERWARIKRTFGASARQCLEQAQAELEDM